MYKLDNKIVQKSQKKFYDKQTFFIFSKENGETQNKCCSRFSHKKVKYFPVPHLIL